ncbi:MAG: N-acetylmuramoyl-L-alanine amidase [Candidatus Magnetoovum sp. WYHC-5]|nr:N-acetylmuramoyl-L-alanine amidase [Candidatus Magnetoovum sp. WYHC-5]
MSSRKKKGLAVLLMFLLIFTHVPQVLPYAPLCKVKNIRYWANDAQYIRVVVDLTEPVDFIKGEVVERKKIFFDIYKSELVGFDNKHSIEIANNLLKRIRVGQYDEETVRVVLDLNEYESYKYFTLTDPYRIIIDIYGVDKTYKPQEELASKSIENKNTVITPSIPQPAPQVVKKPTATFGASNSTVTVTQKAFVAKKDFFKSTPIEVSKPVYAPTAPAKEQKEAVDIKQKLVAKKEQISMIVPDVKTMKKAIKKIVLDPGHGGHDTGAIGPSGMMEKNVVLDVALKLKALLQKQYGYEVTMTRDKDVYLSLNERTAIANKSNADLFVSIHVNADDSGTARGIETYFLNWTNDKEAIKVAARENDITVKKMESAQSELGVILSSLARESKRDESLRLAHFVQNSLVSNVKRNTSYGIPKNLGVKQALFYVLIGASMPAVLAELSFITHQQEEQFLSRKEYRVTMAKALASGISQYLGTVPDNYYNYADANVNKAIGKKTKSSVKN